MPALFLFLLPVQAMLAIALLFCARLFRKAGYSLHLALKFLRFSIGKMNAAI